MKVLKKDKSIIQTEILTSLRGDRSQGMINQKMGYRFNQAYRWESGRTQIKWKEFVRLCRVCKADLPLALEKSLIYFGDVSDASLIIKHLIGKRSLLEVSKAFGISRFSLQDWASGVSDARLEFMLELFRHFDELTFFVETLLGGRMIPALEEDFQRRKQQLQLFYNFPIYGVVVTALELFDYRALPKHEDGFIAKRLGISIAEEKECLKKLLAVGTIKKSKGIYVKVSEQTSTKGDYEAEKRICNYWVQKGVEISAKQKRPSATNTSGFLLFAVNEDQEKRIRAALIDFAGVVNKITREPPKSGQKLKVMTLQMFGTEQ